VLRCLADKIQYGSDCIMGCGGYIRIFTANFYAVEHYLVRISGNSSQKTGVSASLDCPRMGKLAKKMKNSEKPTMMRVRN